MSIFNNDIDQTLHIKEYLDCVDLIKTITNHSQPLDDNFYTTRICDMLGLEGRNIVTTRFDIIPYLDDENRLKFVEIKSRRPQQANKEFISVLSVKLNMWDPDPTLNAIRPTDFDIILFFNEVYNLPDAFNVDGSRKITTDNTHWPLVVRFNESLRGGQIIPHNLTWLYNHAEHLSRLGKPMSDTLQEIYANYTTRYVSVNK